MNSRSIDEFLLIFLVCAVANGVSKFNKIGELRNKETDRLKFANTFLNNIGIKTKLIGIKNLKDSSKVKEWAIQ